MNKSALDTIWNQMRQKYGIYLRVLEAIPENKIHEHPIPGMRTAAELVAHTSGGIVRGFAQGVATGEIVDGPSVEETASKIQSKDDMLAFARECWQDADAAVTEVGDDELTRMVKTPWNMEFRGSVAMHTMNDEFVHHRGQLYAYVRACGAEPPFVWSYGENPPGFGPDA
ncbi:MAG: DinB family protein [Gemmatimonadota bacterium]